MSSTGDPYTNPVGEGFLGSYLVRNGRELRSQIGAPVLREMNARAGDRVGVHPHPDGIVLSSPPADRETITDLQVTVSGEVTLTATVLRDHLGAGDGDYLRFYEHDVGLLAVVDHDDPRVRENEDGDST